MEAIRFGICTQPEQLPQVARAGYDYIELDLNRVLAMGEDAYRAMTAQMQRFDLYAEVVHAPLPEGSAIVGDGVSAQRLHDELSRSFQLARILGAELVVFDCAASRSLPWGFDPAMAWRQLGNLIRMMQSHAADSGLRVALLPLRRSSAELMNYVTEATLISAMLRLDRVGVAASRYNMAMEAESLPQLRRTGSLLWHMRVSNVLGNRLPRTGDGEDYAALFATLGEMDYGGRVSAEGSWVDFDADATAALACLRNACRAAQAQL